MPVPAHLIRLQREYDQMLEMHQRNGLVQIIAVEGSPPERYLISFNCLGIAEISTDGQPKYIDEHRVIFSAPVNYPSIRPAFRWITPIFHPNFDSNGNVCIVSWYPQETMREMCESMVEMVQYKIYNVTSPLNMQAAMWAMRHQDQLPVEARGIYDTVPGRTQARRIERSIQNAMLVVSDRLPIWQPPVMIQPVKTEAARFCGECGSEFPDDQSIFCPKCGTRRAYI